ncbi:hypothetical protein [Planctellipticum variicoloris]|uniref:hypothetical protein n=1 Tax=Planctellipticum variicoloris TaxID=3064265 RepID=UPI0030138EAC|nr:hypothetical protein SH412_005092 [Planctomycetaceae bacterium SH412]
MRRVHLSSSTSVRQMGALAVFFETENGHLKHVGLLYRDSDTQAIRKLHLAWHFHLLEEPCEDAVWWIRPGVDDERLVQVAAIGRKVWRSNGKRVPYGFSHPNDAFDAATGQLLFGPTRHGLTCASFVLAVFHCAGIPLIDYDDWPARPDDADWQRQIIETLELRNCDKAHVVDVRGQIGAVRYRPGEVAGASIERIIPTSLAIAERNCESIRQLINNS